MKTFTYPFLPKIILKYGNIPSTLILSLYMIFFIAKIDTNLLYLIPLVFLLLLIYFLNKKYLEIYKLVPFKIEADNDKLICTGFFLSKRKIIVYYKNINSLTGGVFNKKLSGMMKICDGTDNVCIGFFNSIKNAGELQTIILSKIKRDIYDDVLKQLGMNKQGEVKK